MRDNHVGAPGTCDQNGPAGTSMIQRFQMYSATVTVYQKTTIITSNPSTRRLRERRQVLEGQPASNQVDPNDPSLQNLTAPLSGSDNSTGSNNSTGSSNSTGWDDGLGYNNSTDGNNSTGETNSTSWNNSTDENNSTGWNNSTDLNATQPITNFTTIDMTPAEPTSWDCYAGKSFRLHGVPSWVFCRALLTRNPFVTYPGTFVHR